MYSRKLLVEKVVIISIAVYGGMKIGVKFQKELKVVSLKERFYRKQILIYLGKYIVYVMYIQY